MAQLFTSATWPVTPYANFGVSRCKQGVTAHAWTYRHQASILKFFIPRSQSYCLGLSLPLCLEWYNGSGAFRRDQTSTGRLRPPATVGISVLNHCLEWDKFVRLTLTYPTPDSWYSGPTKNNAFRYWKRISRVSQSIREIDTVLIRLFQSSITCTKSTPFRSIQDWFIWNFTSTCYRERHLASRCRRQVRWCCSHRRVRSGSTSTCSQASPARHHHHSNVIVIFSSISSNNNNNNIISNQGSRWLHRRRLSRIWSWTS